MNNEYLDYTPAPEPNNQKPQKNNNPENNKKTAIIIASVVAVILAVIVIIVVAVKKSEADNEPSNSVNSGAVEEDSSKHQYVTKTEVVTNASGETVTDADGNAVTEAVTDADGNAVTEVATPTIPPVENPDPLEEGTKTEDTHLRDEIVKPVFESGKFTMSVNVVAEGITMPMTMTVDGEDFAFLVSMESFADMEGSEEMMAMVGDDIKIICKDGKTYTAMEMLGQKIYMETGEDTLGMDMSGLMNPTADDSQTYVQTTTVKNGNKTYTCEEYKADDGTVTKYYFEGRNFVRVEIIGDGASSVMEISEFKNSVDSSIFSLNGYKEFDTSSLSGM